MRDTMRDLLSKLDGLVSETELNPADPKGDYAAKSKALQDLQQTAGASDPEIKSAIVQRKADLNKEAKAKGIFEIGDAFGISFSEDHEIATEIVDILEDGIVIELDDTALEMLANEGLTFLEGEIVKEEKQKGVDGKACWKGYKRMGTKQKGGKTVDNCVKMEGNDSKEYDDEAGMADNNLETLKRAVVGLDDLINAGDNLPEWCQEKIAVSKSMLVSVWDYMQSEKSVDEAKYQGREVPLGKKMAGDVKKSKVYVRKPNGKIVKVNFGDKKMRIKKSNPARRKSFRARHNCKNPGPRWKARYWSCRSW
jgi:hypothetical protein